MSTWRKFLQWVMDHRPTKVMVVAGEPLFYRSFLFQLGPWVCYMHHYLRSDPDDASAGRSGLHDHPMRAVVVILAGGYREERLLGFGRHGLRTTYISRRPGTVFRISEYVFHRVVIHKVRVFKMFRSGGPRWVGVQPTSWSLFFSRYVDKQWGFLVACDAPEAPDVDKQRDFRYVEAGAGIDDEEPWWKTAPRGKDLRSDGGQTRRAEPQP